jgi:hypothetical protein
MLFKLEHHGVPVACKTWFIDSFVTNSERKQCTTQTENRTLSLFGTKLDTVKSAQTCYSVVKQMAGCQLYNSNATNLVPLPSLQKPTIANSVSKQHVTKTRWLPQRRSTLSTMLQWSLMV